MFKKTFYHTLSDGTKAKFTILDRIIDGEVFFYPCVVGTEIESYMDLNSQEKETYLGVEILNKRCKINYRDCDKLISDILIKYDYEGLETEK